MFHEAAIQTLLDELEVVPEIRAACDVAGINERTLRLWRKDCPTLDRLLRKVLSGHVSSYIKTVDRIAKNEDHKDSLKAAQWMTGKLSPLHWGDQPLQMLPRGMDPEKAHELMVKAFAEPTDIVRGALEEAGWRKVDDDG